MQQDEILHEAASETRVQVVRKAAELQQEAENIRISVSTIYHRRVSSRNLRANVSIDIFLFIIVRKVDHGKISHFPSFPLESGITVAFIFFLTFLIFYFSGFKLNEVFFYFIDTKNLFTLEINVTREEVLIAYRSKAKLLLL